MCELFLAWLFHYFVVQLPYLFLFIVAFVCIDYVKAMPSLCPLHCVSHLPDKWQQSAERSKNTTSKTRKTTWGGCCYSEVIIIPWFYRCGQLGNWSIDWLKHLFWIEAWQGAEGPGGLRTPDSGVTVIRTNPSTKGISSPGPSSQGAWAPGGKGTGLPGVTAAN